MLLHAAFPAEPPANKTLQHLLLDLKDDAFFKNIFFYSKKIQIYCRVDFT